VYEEDSGGSRPQGWKERRGKLRGEGLVESLEVSHLVVVQAGMSLKNYEKKKKEA